MLYNDQIKKRKKIGKIKKIKQQLWITNQVVVIKRQFKY